ncbi:hypothetical protein Hanom_Chr17g01561811 [Helianthus anomalus]
MRKNKPLDESCKSGQTLGTKMAFYSILNKETTFTTCLAASSAGKPRQDFAAISDGTASQMPSEAIISLPPAFDNFCTKT